MRYGQHLRSIPGDLRRSSSPRAATAAALRRRGFVACLSAALLTLVLPPARGTAAPVSAGSATVLVVGDSLSAEYGLPRDSGWVALLGRRLADRAPEYSVVNASISGDTTGGGRARLEALLREHRPAVVIIELGANDGLRGLNLDAMRANLQAMIDACRTQGARVLLVGMRLPPNYGDRYAEGFHSVYTQLAARNRVPLVPFLMDGFAERRDWFQADQLHPLPPAEPRMLENVWSRLLPLLARR
jgi:acyl-CoA thioesterase-1